MSAMTPELCTTCHVHTRSCMFAGSRLYVFSTRSHEDCSSIYIGHDANLQSYAQYMAVSRLVSRIPTDVPCNTRTSPQIVSLSAVLLDNCVQY